MFEIDDLARPGLETYKVYVFLNAYRLTAAQVWLIEKKLKRNAKTLVWLFAPGYLADHGLSRQGTSKMVGMRLAVSPEPTSLQCEAILGDHPLALGLLPIQGTVTRASKFWVDDPMTVALARYVDTGEIAIAARDLGTWRSVYIASPGGLGPRLLNNIARWSGAYVCSEPGDAIYINSHLLCVHGVTGGPRTFRLPRRASVIDLMSGATLAVKSETFRAEIPLQRTRWFGLYETRSP